MTVDLLWRVALLAAIFVADLAVFIALCREEIRETLIRRAAGRARPRAQRS